MTALALLDVTPHEIVLWKPPGLAAELPRDPNAESVVARLRSQGFDGLRLVHRLDAPACGVMIVARSPKAAAHYSAEIAARRWQKFYVADVAAPIAHVQSLLGRHRAYLATEGRKATIVRSGGKPSFLTILDVASDGPRAFVFVHLHTGRFHQIRVMLAALGAPLTGDPLYGGGADPAGSLYLEHVLLAARPFGSAQSRVWRSPAANCPRRWPATLAAAVDARAASLLSED